MAVIEIVSPGNKSSKAAIRTFVDKAVQFLRQGVHLLIIDLFPPTPRDPQGLHKLIWDEILEEPFALPPTSPSPGGLLRRVGETGLRGTGWSRRRSPRDAALPRARTLHPGRPLEPTYLDHLERLPMRPSVKPFSKMRQSSERMCGR